MKKKVWNVLVGLFATCSLHAADLMDVYRQALENDPTFKAAYNDFMANAELLPQARSVLLPQLLATSYVSRNFISVAAGSELSIDQTYNSQQWQLAATQTLFNYKYWAQVQQAKASVKAAHASFNDSLQDLLLRTSSAYLTVLYARDTLNFAESKLRANKRQLDQAQNRFEVGVDTITSVYEAKAAYDQSIAEVITAKNNQINQSENLRKLTNHVYEALAPLRNSTIPLIRPEPDDVNVWIDTGIKQNYKLVSAKYSMEASREKLKGVSAGNWPTFAVQGTKYQLHNSGGGSNFFVPSHQDVNSVALTMTFPVYQGGLVESQTRQAQYNFKTSSEQMEQAYREVVVNSHIAFNTIVDGISKIKADRQTLISQQNSLESTEAQFQVGTRTMVDVTNAQQRLFDAQRQLAADQYDFINAVLNLKYLAGTLNITDLEEINSWLATTQVNGFPPAERAVLKKKYV